MSPSQITATSAGQKDWTFSLSPVCSVVRPTYLCRALIFSAEIRCSSSSSRSELSVGGSGGSVRAGVRRNQPISRPRENRPKPADAYLRGDEWQVMPAFTGQQQPLVPHRSQKLNLVSTPPDLQTGLPTCYHFFPLTWEGSSGVAVGLYALVLWWSERCSRGLPGAFQTVREGKRTLMAGSVPSAPGQDQGPLQNFLKVTRWGKV